MLPNILSGIEVKLSKSINEGFIGFYYNLTVVFSYKERVLLKDASRFKSEEDDSDDDDVPEDEIQCRISTTVAYLCKQRV